MGGSREESRLYLVEKEVSEGSQAAGEVQADRYFWQLGQCGAAGCTVPHAHAALLGTA